MKHRGSPPDEVAPAIPDDNAPLPTARPGTRWTVRRGRTIALVLIGLALAVSLLAVYATYQEAERSAREAQKSTAQAAAVDRRLDVLEQDLAERTRQRDQEREAGEARDAEFSAYLCSVLGQLPADTPSLNQLRAALGCIEPGMASPPATTSPAPASSSGREAPDGRPTSAAGASPPAPRPAPAAPRGDDQPPATTTSAPPVPTAQPEPTRGPLRDLICSLPLLC